MRFLKTLLWVTVIVGLVVFATNNWQPVSLRLWGGLRLDTKLPALVLAAFLAIALKRNPQEIPSPLLGKPAPLFSLIDPP